MDFDRPDADKPHHLKTLAQGADYFADLGRLPGQIAAVLLAPAAGYLMLAGLITPFAGVVFGARGEWPVAWMLVGIGAGHGIVGLGLAWFARRLWRGAPSANGLTVLPTWLVATFLVVFLTPLCLGMAGMFALMAADELTAGRVGVAGILAAGAVGWVVGLWRAYRTLAWLVRPRAGG